MDPEIVGMLNQLLGERGIAIVGGLISICAGISALIPQETQEKSFVLRLIDKIGLNVGKAKTQ